MRPENLYTVEVIVMTLIVLVIAYVMLLLDVSVGHR
jgi:hypothetical protein